MITEKDISIKKILKSVRDDSVGLHVLFIGTVRNFSEVDTVVGMYYESYTRDGRRENANYYRLC